MLQSLAYDPEAPNLPDRGSRVSLARGLALLAQAYHYAKQTDQDVWQFAVENAALRDRGLTNNDFRWLVCKGYVQHAPELTAIGQQVREFKRAGGMLFTRRTCFVLTESGLALAEECQKACAQRRRPRKAAAVAQQLAIGDGLPAAAPVRRALDETPLKPTWDCERREIRMGKYLVKQFRLPSANQEMILTAFEEEGWPVRIDDPLPQLRELDPKRRLHDAIKGLNRHQKHRLIRFMGDGSGQGVRWEAIEPAAAS